MENKNNKGVIALLIIIIVILSVLCVLFATGTITFNGNNVEKENSNQVENNNSNQNDEENNGQEENSNLPGWANYLLSQNITDIIYEKGHLEIDEVTGLEDCTPPQNLTKEQLKSILLKMTASKLNKYYAGGFGGPCWSGIIVKYNNQELKIYAGSFIVAGDNNIDSQIVSLLEQEEYVVEGQNNQTNSLVVYKYDWDSSYIDTLIKN